MGASMDGLVSVVIPTRNEGALLRMTIDSVLEQTRSSAFEIVVVDDGSTDGSCDPFNDGDTRISVVRSSGVGVAAARNLGALHARGELLVFLDAHCLVSPDWLVGLTSALVDSDVGIAGPCFTRLRQPLPRGCGMAWMDYSLDPCWLEVHDTDHPYEVPLTTGACQALRRVTFEALGRYEEGFTRWGFEDTELCLRTWLLGYRVLGAPGVTVAHYFRESRNYTVDDLEITYNFLRMVHLHLAPRRIREVLKAVSSNALVPRALDRLYAGDIFNVRSRLLASRVRDDDWFFANMNGELSG